MKDKPDANPELLPLLEELQILDLMKPSEGDVLGMFIWKIKQSGLLRKIRVLHPKPEGLALWLEEQLQHAE